MNLWDSAAGMIHVRLVSADIAETLRRAGDFGITIYRMQTDEDGLTCRFYIRRSAWKAMVTLAQRRGDKLEVVRKYGIYWKVNILTRRYALLLGILFLTMLSIYLPTRILFVTVEGNQIVSDQLILAAAENAGVSFGASRSALRSEKLKNALLESVPQLQWVGVNTSGCLAVITVRERPTAQVPLQSYGVCSIIAARDGVVSQITVERGNGICAVGQAVKAGQVLISGYTDCGLTIQATRASGEVYANTERKLTVVTPSKWNLRGGMTDQQKKISLILGKKRINLYKGSGISPTGCVKMYTEYHLTLPGGFRLPVSWVLEQWHTADFCTEAVAAEAGCNMLSDFAKGYLIKQMIAGQILTGSEIPEAFDGVLTLRGTYACREMIGQIRSEEIIQ